MKKRILIFMPHNPGDVVMALHAAAQIRALDPDADLNFLAGGETLDFLNAIPMLRRVFALPGAAVRKQWEIGGADGALREVSDWVEQLEAETYECALNLFQGRFGGLIQSFVRADRKSGLELKDGSRPEIGSRALEHLFAIPARRAQNPFHAVDLYRMAATELLRIPWPSNPAPKLELALPGNPAPFPKGSYFAFHPGAAYRGKRWPVERWIRLAELCLEAGRSIAWTGAPEETDLVRSISGALPPRFSARQTDLAGQTSLRSAAAVYQGAERVVCGDTAAMHLAAAVGTPVIALFGPSNPVETGPYGRGHIVIHVRPVTEPDLRLDDDDPELAGVGAEAVMKLLLHHDPSAFSQGELWRTDVDESLGIQILRDPENRVHPFQRHAVIWLEILLNRIAADNPAPETPLLRALAGAEASATAENLRALEAAESLAAESSRDDLVWEAYRIALNGLPVLPVPDHLRLRRNLLRRASRESRRLAVVSRSPEK